MGEKPELYKEECRVCWHHSCVKREDWTWHRCSKEKTAFERKDSLILTLRLEPLYTLLSESSLVDFVSISHTAKRLPPKIRICLVCYQKEIWSKQHGSNWGLQESQIRHSFSQVSEIFQISVDLASFQLLEKLKKVCPWHVQACPSGNFPTFI